MAARVPIWTIIPMRFRQQRANPIAMKDLVGVADSAALRRRLGDRAASRAGFRRGLAAVWVLVAAWVPGNALAYDGEIHQQLTFIAARHYNQCAEGTSLALLTPLQVRYIAKANANQAEQPWWQRLFRWNYYDRSEQSAGRVLWLLETRMHNSFRDTLARLDSAQDLGRRFTSLGRVVGHVQDATTPSFVAPIFTTRWWRFNIGDRFASFPVDGEALGAPQLDMCSAARGADGTFEALLAATADRTLASIREPIRGMPATWEAFWEFDKDDDDFGSYGAAGNNFGRQTTFRCPGERQRDCVLLAGDPLYYEYAEARHLDAVRATVSALAMMLQRVATPVEPGPPVTPSLPIAAR